MESITEAMLRDDLNAVQVWINALKSARRLEGVYARVVQALAITRDAEERQEKILQVMDGLREQAAELEGVVREAERRAAQAAGSFQEAERKSTEAIEAVRREHADALRRLNQDHRDALEIATSNQRRALQAMEDERAVAVTSHEAFMSEIGEKQRAAAAEYASHLSTLKTLQGAIGLLMPESSAVKE